MKKLDEFYYHEALDRTHCILAMMEELLMKHPVIKKHKNVKKELQLAENALWNAYQLVGKISDSEMKNADIKNISDGELFNIVKEIISSKLGVEEKKITLSTSFITDLRTDSLDILEITDEIEKRFKIKIKDSGFKKIENILGLIAYVKSLL